MIPSGAPSLAMALADPAAQRLDTSGGKGASLARLVAQAMRVPDGFVITSEAYRAVAKEVGLEGIPPRERAETLGHAELPAPLRDVIGSRYRALGGGAVAVRSSATAEDLDDSSFAGQHDTFLEIVGEDALLDAVRRCWASLWSERAVEYRRERGWDDEGLAMAVVVQRMVPAQWSGVLFTVDPVSGDRSSLVVEAVRGLGEALVSGEASGQRWRIDRDSGDARGDGDVPPSVLADLHHAALTVEAAFGGPQDIEWAAADGQTWLLQARPLTVVGAAGERTSPVSPLARAFAPTAIDHVPITPLPFDTSLFFGPLFERILGAARSVGVGLPPTGQVLVEIADGVVQVRPPMPRPTRRLIRLPFGLLRALRSGMDGWLDDAERRIVRRALDIDAEDRSTLSDADILARVEELQALLVEASTTRLLPLARGAIVSVAFGRLLRAMVGADASAIERALLAEPPCTTTAANLEIERIAARIRSSDRLRALFDSGDSAALPARLSESADGAVVVRSVEAYLDRFGLRETVLPSAGFPAWRDDPALVYGLLTGLVRAPNDRFETDWDAARRTLIRRLQRGRGPRRLLLPPLLALLGATRAFLGYREESHYRAFVAFPVVRRLALELGRRLAERGAIHVPDDVFFLHLEELVCGNESAYRETVARRTTARRSVRDLTIVPLELARAAGGELLTGTAVSPGLASGRVKVIRSEGEFSKLAPGDVLVAPYTNPTWTPLFRIAAAVVVDGGGAASHAAIVAREYGLPAVMGTMTGTRELRDGEIVLVDGGAGRVTRMRRAAS